MRLPFIQVTNETWELAAQLAGLLQISVAEGFKLQADLWRWALSLGPDDVPPQGVCDSPRASRLCAAAVGFPTERADELITTLVDLELVERLEVGLRVKGTDRYRAAWTKNRRLGHGKDDKTPPPAANPPPTRPGSERVLTGTHPPDADADADADAIKEKQQPSHSRSQNAPSPVEEFVAAWNALGKPFPACLKITTKRRRAIEARLREEPDFDRWKRALTVVASSRFLAGQNERRWVANIDFLLRPDTLTKIEEGTYTRPGDRPPPPPLSEAEVRWAELLDAAAEGGTADAYNISLMRGWKPTGFTAARAVLVETDLFLEFAAEMARGLPSDAFELVGRNAPPTVPLADMLAEMEANS